MANDENIRKAKMNKMRNMGDRPISAKARKNDYVSPNIKKVEIDDLDSDAKSNTNNVNKQNNSKPNNQVVFNKENIANNNSNNKGKNKITKTNKKVVPEKKNNGKEKENENKKPEPKKKVVNEKEKEAFIEKMDTIKKLSKEEKRGAYKKGIVPLLEGIVVIIFTFALTFVYYKCQVNVCDMVYKIVSMVLLLGAIALFEIAYKKNNGEIGLIGVEILVLAITTLVGFYVYTLPEYKEHFETYMMVVGIGFAGYFVIKMIVRFIKAKKKHNDNISDVKKIVDEVE